MDLRAACDDALTRGDAVKLAAPPSAAEWPGRVAKEEREGNRALVGPSTGGSCAHLVANFFGSRERLHRALRVADEDELFERLIEAGARPRAFIASQDLAEGRRCIDRPDLLAELPAIRHSADDAMPYLTSGILVALDAESATHHYCYVRMAMTGGHRMVVNPATRRMRALVERHLQSGQPLEVAILIGPPAAVVLTACTSAPGNVAKYEIAQAFSAGRLAFAEHAVPVPADTEIVLTGRLLPEFRQEGPVGDQKGLYSLRQRNPVCDVDALWARPDARFHLVAGGVSREHIELVTLGPRAALHRIRRATPAILRCAMPAFAGGRLAVLVVREDFDPATVLDGLWAISSVRGFIAVNEDVAEASAPDLLWSILERARLPAQFRFSDAGHPVSGARKFFIDATSRDPADWNERRIRVYEP